MGPIFIGMSMQWMPFFSVSMHACMHAYIHTYVHTYMHTYIHTYTHTDVHALAVLHTCHNIPLQNAGDVCQEYQTTLAQSSIPDIAALRSLPRLLTIKAPPIRLRLFVYTYNYFRIYTCKVYARIHLVSPLVQCPTVVYASVP